MFDVHGDVGHCGNTDVIESPHEGPIKLFAALE